jgi:hypothetical protein
MNSNNKIRKRREEKNDKIIEHFTFGTLIRYILIAGVFVVIYAVYKTGGFKKLFGGKGKKGGTWGPKWAQKSKPLTFDAAKKLR